MGRFSNSWATVKASWGVLKQDKELALFPIFSGIASAIVMASFVAPTYVSGLLDRALAEEPDAQNMVFAIYAVMYLVLAFVTVYFNSALVAGASERLSGGDPTIGSSLRGANKRLGKIFAWAMFAGTVSLLIHLAERATRGRGGFVGHFVVQMVGVAWTLATFFAIPVVVFEDRGVFGSLRRSGELFRKTWGESVVGEFGIGLVFGVLSIVTVVATLALAYLFLSVPGAGLLLALGAVIVGVLLLVTLTIVGSALGTIYKAALYRYASQNAVSPGFQPAMIQDAYRPIHPRA